MPPIPLITPNAFARDSSEVNAIVVRMYTGGIKKAVPTPWNTELPRISTPSLGAIALRTVPIPYSDQTPGEAALAAPAVGQLAAGDHQHGHDQQEQRDRGLHALHVRVQIVADVVDHHVHVRAREAADELRKRERSDERARRADPARRRRGSG